MKRIDTLRDISTRYDEMNDSPFEITDDMRLEAVHPAFVGDVVCQSLIDWKALQPSSDSELAQQAGTETAESPATNRGLAKYRDNWGGYDGGIEVSIAGTWLDDRLVMFAQRLDACKQAADDGRSVESYLDICGLVWRVSSMGATSGFFRYKWVMESHGVKVYIHSNPRGKIIPIRVRFGFECLARTNLFVAADTLRDVLSEVGFRWECETLSRVDMQVLIPVDIYEFVQAMQGPRVVTRCRGVYQLNANMDTMRIETITLRSTNCELCIYDKRAQVLQADSVYVDTFYKHVLQDDVIPDNLTRVEFRLKRGMLRRYGISTLADLRRVQGTIIDVVGYDWFRILARDKVRGSEKEIPNAPIWEATLAAFRHYFGSDKAEVQDMQTLRDYKAPTRTPSLERILKQAAGLLSSAAAYALTKVTSTEQILDYCMAQLAEQVSDMYFKVVDKQVSNAVVRRYTADGYSVYTDTDEILEAVASVSPYKWDFLEFA